MAKRTPNPISDDIARYWHHSLNEKQPTDYTAGSGFKVWWTCEKDHEFYAAIQDVTSGHGCPYCAGNKAWAGYNDLQSVHPDIADEWHPQLNGELSPNNVTFGSKTKVWWLGKCGHDFYASINSRTASGNRGCPYCAGQKILVGFNDLATTHPETAALWHLTKNTKTPQEVTAGTLTKVWWVGECGHEFPCAIAEKVRTGKGCPYCAGKKVLAGFNDLASNYPDIAKEWSSSNELKPDAVSHKSVVKFEWVCPAGHTYPMAVRARTRNGSGCQYCSGKKRLVGHNDLISTHPHLLDEWDYEMNGSLKPESFGQASMQKVWWKCGEGHSYEVSIYSKTNTRKVVGCTVCSNRSLHVGVNDLATTHPVSMEQWHYEKNGDLKPTDVLASLSSKVWWICAEGHEWHARPKYRFNKDGTPPSGCPVCQAKSFSSSAEREIAEILTSIGEEVITGSRKVLKGSELDIYLPQRNFAIEYNGLYWHSMDKNGMHKDYHRNKWNACREQNIQLLQVWEDDWNNRRPIVLRGLFYKLGIIDRAAKMLPELGIAIHPREYARQMATTKVPLTDAQAFFAKNHIQGFASGSHYLGLRNRQGELVACVVLKKESANVLNIIRYATDRTVSGGFTKLLVYAERNLDVERFITFSDHCVSDGGLYANNGFEVDKELSPDYSYVVRGKREHKFGYRLKRFKTDPDLRWEEGLTERELAELNGLNRIYDAGKTRWAKTVTR